MRTFLPDDEARTRRALWLAAAFVLALLLLVYVWQTSYVAQFRFDDSYITLRYAQQLSRHGILSFNPDEHIDGYTSPAWTLLLASVDALGFDPAQAMLVLSRACGYLSVIASCILARALGASSLLALAVPAAGVLYTPGFIVWSIPGMEMPFVALIYSALLASMAAHSRAGGLQTWLRASLLLVAALARPEGTLLAGLLLAVEILALRSELASSARRQVWPPYLAVVGLLLVLMGWRWRFYGYPLPNTFYAKSPTPALIERGLSDARSFLAQRGLVLAPLAALVLALAPAARRTRLLLLSFALWFVCVMLVYARSGGDFPGFHRFYQPLVPASFAVLAYALSRLVAALTRLGANDGVRRLALPVAAVLGVVCLVDLSPSSVLREAFVKNTGLVASQTDQVESWARAGRALSRVCQAGSCPHPTRVATRAAGAIAHYSRADRVYDTLALNNPEVAHHNRPVRDVPAHQKEATDAQVLAWKPNIIVGHPDVELADRSGAPPARFDRAAFRAAGFAYRCIPTEQPAEFFCFWQRDDG